MQICPPNRPPAGGAPSDDDPSTTLAATLPSMRLHSSLDIFYPPLASASFMRILSRECTNATACLRTFSLCASTLPCLHGERVENVTGNPDKNGGETVAHSPQGAALVTFGRVTRDSLVGEPCDQKEGEPWEFQCRPSHTKYSATSKRPNGVAE